MVTLVLFCFVPAVSAQEVSDESDGPFTIAPELPPGATTFEPLAPCRALDTRTSNGPALDANERRIFVVTGVCGIPLTATAIVANLTVVGASATGDLRVTGAHLTSTITSALSIPLARARANNAMIQLATDGSGAIAVTNGSEGTVHLILDVNGYFE